MTTEVIRANIQVHTRMAESYDRLEPHFRPENRAKVRKILEGIALRSEGGRLLDLGCGTGFIIGLAKDLFREIHGVDVTRAMLDRVDISGGNVALHCQPAEALPFEDNSFDAATAYSFIHHLEDYRPVLREAYRVLKPGGVFYIDLEPNKLFWDRMAVVAEFDGPLPPIVAKARDAVLHTDAQVEKDFGIPSQVFQKAEFGKAILGGVDADRAKREARAIGFREVTVKFDWYLGQGEIMHGKSFDEAAKVESYLREIAPLSDSLFKYVQLLLVK